MISLSNIPTRSTQKMEDKGGAYVDALRVVMLVGSGEENQVS